MGAMERFTWNSWFSRAVSAKGQRFGVIGIEFSSLTYLAWCWALEGKSHEPDNSKSLQLFSQFSDVMFPSASPDRCWWFRKCNETQDHPPSNLCRPCQLGALEDYVHSEKLRSSEKTISSEERRSEALHLNHSHGFVKNPFPLTTTPLEILVSHWIRYPVYAFTYIMWSRKSGQFNILLNQINVGYMCACMSVYIYIHTHTHTQYIYIYIIHIYV